MTLSLVDSDTRLAEVLDLQTFREQRSGVNQIPTRPPYNPNGDAA